MDLGLNVSLGTRYRSGSQIARVLSEDWVSRELPCIACGANPLGHAAANSPALDFVCPECTIGYELKSKRTAFGSRLLDGEYGTLVSRLSADAAPNFLLMRYDLSSARVEDLFAVPSGLLTPLAIERRPPLPPTARRAGWVGSVIDLSLLPEGAMVPIVRNGVARSFEAARRDWRNYREITSLKPELRGWVSDVLSCVQRLPNGVFRLDEVYSFEAALQRSHPGNQHVRPKIRQQLQALVSMGYLQRLAPGLYRRLGGSTDLSSDGILPAPAPGPSRSGSGLSP